MTHGLALDHRTFTDQVTALRDRYRVVTWDLPGCGSSFALEEPFSFADAADCLEGILDEIGADEAVLLGQSMGSFLNQYAASRAPELASALIHVGGAPLYDGLTRLESGLVRVHARVVPLVPERVLCRLFGAFVTGDPEVRTYVEETAAQTGKTQFVHLERGIGHQLRTGIADEPTHPQLIVVGEHELSRLRTLGRRWAVRLPDARFVELPGAGHLLNQEDPAAFNAVVLEFLEETTR